MSREQEFESWWLQQGRVQALEVLSGLGLPSSAEDGLKRLARDAFLGEVPRSDQTLYAWVGQDGAEKGVARLKTAWLPLGTINLVAFDRDTMTHPNLVDALQRQANEDGQTVRLLRFVQAGEVMAVEPRSGANGEAREH
jgi:hypothetical protein